MPTKNGEMIAATAVVPAASPICSPEKCSVDPSQVPMVTYHAPHTKYCRNIRVDSFTRVVAVMGTVRVRGFGIQASGSGSSVLWVFGFWVLGSGFLALRAVLKGCATEVVSWRGSG